MSPEALRRLVVVSGFNAGFTLAFPAALVALIYVPEPWSALPWLVILALFWVVVHGYTILGLRRYLSTECGFDGASTALAVTAGLTAAFGAALLVGWGVLRFGSGDSTFSWVLGAAVLGFFLLGGIAIGVLELVIGFALRGITAERYGLLGPIRITFLVLGIANLSSLVLGVTIIVGVVAYAVISMLWVLLFYAAWREGGGRPPGEFCYGRRWIAAVVTASILSVMVPGVVAIHHLRTFLQEEEFEVLEEDARAYPEWVE